MPSVNINQLNQAQLIAAIQLYSSGAAFSGNVVAYALGGGWFGNNLVYTTGGDVDIAGIKRFLSSPLVPYSGNTGSAPSARWVNDQIAAYSGNAGGSFVQSGNLIQASGQLAYNTYVTGSGLYTLLVNQSGQASTDYATKTQLFNTGAALSKVRVTGGGTIQDANFSGIGGTQIVHSGGLILVSGGAGGGGGSNVQATGSSVLATANFTGNGAVTVTYDGTFVRISGAEGVGAAYSGFVDSTYVRLTGAQTISGTKTFATTPLIPSGATNGTEAVNLAQLSGASGVLAAQGGGVTNNYYITGTGFVGVSSNASGNISNTFSITSGTTNIYNTGTTTNSFTTSGPTTVINSGSGINTFNGATTNVNNYNINQPTGNFTNVSFYFDEYSLTTGLNYIEAMVGRSFVFTGYGLGAINTGTQGFFSGSFYQRTPTNIKTNFINFSLNSGSFFYASGGFSQEISGMNRLGLDIYRIGTGITGLSVAAFGVGY